MPEKALTKMNLALVATGGNLPSSAGSPEASLRAATAKISKIPQVFLVAVSRFWTTPAYPAGSGPNYVNAAVSLKTTLSAADLLAHLHEIEAEFGRVRQGKRWQARPLDLDLIAYEDAVLPDAATQDRWRAIPAEEQARNLPDCLILPHPRLQDRGFVLAPLADIAPGWRHPRTGLSVTEMLAGLPPAAMAGISPQTT